MASARRHNMPTKLIVPISLVLVALSGSMCARASSDDSPCSFPAIFNFGDSNSDTGALSALFSGLPPPYGRTFFGMPAGRYSDGRLTVDFMAQNLGLRYLSAYLDSVGSNFTQGASFATAAATIRRANGSIFVNPGYSPISLDVQTWQFQQFINRSRFVYNNKGGIYRDIMPNPENLVSNSLYTFDMGQNDLTAGYFDNMTTEQVEAYVPDLMERISSAIQTVYNLGGRYFWVHNTGPLGCLTYAVVYHPDLAAEKDAAGCSVALNARARFFNARLKETVARLRVTLPGAALTYVDVYAAKYRLISQAKKLGFGNPLHVCCGYGGGQYNFDRNIRCGDKVEVNGTSVLAGKTCEDPSRSVSWDGVHFTEAANRFVFNQIVDGALSDPPMRLCGEPARENDNEHVVVRCFHSHDFVCKTRENNQPLCWPFVPQIKWEINNL